jgi:hypothetical protein
LFKKEGKTYLAHLLILALVVVYVFMIESIKKKLVTTNSKMNNKKLKSFKERPLRRLMIMQWLFIGSSNERRSNFLKNINKQINKICPILLELLEVDILWPQKN